jgi:hypothetical protein
MVFLLLCYFALTAAETFAFTFIWRNEGHHQGHSHGKKNIDVRNRSAKRASAMRNATFGV